MPPRKNRTFSHHHQQNVPRLLAGFSLCLVKLRKNPPNSLPELVKIVERYTASLKKDQIITAVNDIQPRTQACIESDGGALRVQTEILQEKT